MKMEKKDFVPGKIYESKYVYYYVGPSPTNTFNGIFQQKDYPYKNSLHEISFSCNWKEHKEPRKGTRWINVYSGADDNIFTSTWETREQADRNRYFNHDFSATRIACVEVPWVEGQGL